MWSHGGRVGIVGPYLNIDKGSQLMAKSESIRILSKKNKKWGGTPFFTGYMENLRREATAVTHLPALEKRIIELEKDNYRVKE